MGFPTSPQTTLVGQGISPGGGLGAQLSAITRRAVLPVVTVQIYQTHPLLSLLMANAQPAMGGMAQITVPIQGATFTSFNWGSFAGDFPMPTDQQAIENAQFNLKLGMVPIGFFGMEALVQSSEVIIPKLKAVTSDAAVVIKQALAQNLYANNYGNNNALSSLVQAYDNGTNSPSYGGIVRAGTPSWNGQVLNGGAFGMNRAGVAKMLTYATQGAGGEAPDFAVTSYPDWANLMGDFMGIEMIQSSARSRFGRDDVMNSGFRAIRVLDTPIFPDPFCPQGTMYAINSRYLALYLSQAAPMVFSGFESTIPLGQIASIGVLITALELVCSKPSSGVAITGLVNPAFNTPPTPAVL